MTGFEYGIAITIVVILTCLFIYDQTLLNKQEKLINRLKVNSDEKDIDEFVNSESREQSLEYLKSTDDTSKSKK